jgi:hypothetical protein
MAARCDEPCLFLLDTPVDQLGDAFKAACKKDMPDLQLTSCDKLDQIRKCVFAAHGFVFKQKKWKRAYEKKAWYVANPDFRPTQITELERANAVDLDHRAKACKRGISVAPADADRVRSWLAGFDRGRPVWPTLVHKDGVVAPGDEAAAFLHSELYSLSVKKIVVGGKGNTVSYEDALPQDLSGELTIASGAKLRAILVDQSQTNVVDADNSITEGVQIHVIYDDHDRLLAIDVSHFLWD